MKIKMGFVTNSSSSNFLVIFPDKIESITQLNRWIEEWRIPYVFSQIENQEPIHLIQPNFKKLLSFTVDEILQGYVDQIEERLNPRSYGHYNDQENFLKKRFIDEPFKFLYKNSIWQDIYYKDYGKRRKVLATDYALTFFKINPKGWLYKFTFSDDTKIGEKLEHEGTFTHVPAVIHISCH
jgi:hypothetical protein